GEGALKLSLAGQSVSVPVKIGGAEEKHSGSFVGGGMPLLSKVGCKAGTCPRAEEGKKGVKLSPRGSEPHDDHRGAHRAPQCRPRSEPHAAQDLRGRAAHGWSAHLARRAEL